MTNLPSPQSLPSGSSRNPNNDDGSASEASSTDHKVVESQTPLIIPQDKTGAQCSVDVDDSAPETSSADQHVKSQQTSPFLPQQNTKAETQGSFDESSTVTGESSVSPLSPDEAAVELASNIPLQVPRAPSPADSLDPPPTKKGEEERIEGDGQRDTPQTENPSQVQQQTAATYHSAPAPQIKDAPLNNDSSGGERMRGDSEKGSISSRSSTNRWGEGSSAAPRSKKRKQLKPVLNGRRKVTFSHVRIREYDITIGDHHSCSRGPPVTLAWSHTMDQRIPMDVYEEYHVIPREIMNRRHHQTLLLSATERRTRLWRAGHTLESIDAAAEEIERDKWRQSMVGNLEPLFALKEVWHSFLKPAFYTRAKRAQLLDQQLDRISARVRAQHQSQASSVAFTVGSDLRKGARGSNFDDFDVDDDDMDEHDDVEKATGKEQSVMIEGMATILETEKETRRLASRPKPRERTADNNDHSRNKKSNTSGSLNSLGDVHSDKSIGDGSLSDISEVIEESDSSSVSSYGIHVDNKQQDKATEIILKSFRRPHMRAFHAAWMSFFVSFFGWFAITPLLGEVKDTLGLTSSDIWMSHLFGQLGSIVMRVIMGPLCDVFGARRCMAFILVVAAIPTALTGVIQSSFGLSLVRLFIGFGGGSFVACQYWANEMFTREVAGTASALVAGWGNLGGGFSSLIMGSVFFPLFVWIFRDEDDGDGEAKAFELAWRTIFIFPAILSLVASVLILRFTDDSPKGSYKQRMRSENMLVASPIDSFQHAVKNWNVWILTLQYACCFGVEVTMTNATALYFKDEFGQSTVSAAGIASIFGFMNLFARALGGLGSDLFQYKMGIRGRLVWQMATLIMEGIAVGIFAYSSTLASSIVALVFLSIMVQSAEGSTFGIVPYVDRRFTGSVVGLVGSGGTVGGAIFSVFFLQFHGQAAFLLMGLSAVASSFLCCFMQTDKLTQTHAAITEAVEQRNQIEDYPDGISDDDDDEPFSNIGTEEYLGP